MSWKRVFTNFKLLRSNTCGPVTHLVDHRRASSASDLDLYRQEGHEKRFSITSISDTHLPRVDRSKTFDTSDLMAPSRRGSIVPTSPPRRHSRFAEGASPGTGYSTRTVMAQSGFTFLTTSPVRIRWVPADLLDLSDSIRQCLHRKQRLKATEFSRLKKFLDTARAAEVDHLDFLDLDTIKHARLDRLLAELGSSSASRMVIPPAEWGLVTIANNLSRAWRLRFKSDYFAIEETRAKALLTTGALREVEFRREQTPEKVTPSSTLGGWKVTTPEVENFQVKGDLQFNVGDWWLHISCALRDGMVETDLERPTKGKYGTIVLPLLTGEETIIEDSKAVRYKRDSPHVRDAHISLLTQVGKRIRILRGHELNSSYAPAGGIRYDGLWKLTSFSYRMRDLPDRHIVELTLERLDNQPPMSELQKIPRPSQLDDWALYKSLNEQRTEKARGVDRMLDWKVQKAESQQDRERSKQASQFRQSMAWKPPSGKAQTKPVSPPRMETKATDRARKEFTRKEELMTNRSRLRKRLRKRFARMENQSKIEDGDGDESQESSSDSEVGILDDKTWLGVYKDTVSDFDDDDEEESQPDSEYLDELEEFVKGEKKDVRPPPFRPRA